MTIWNADFMISELTFYRGSPLRRSSRLSEKTSNTEPVVTKQDTPTKHKPPVVTKQKTPTKNKPPVATEQETPVEEKFQVTKDNIDAIQKSTEIGSGDFGKTYLYKISESVVKVIKLVAIQSPEHLRNEIQATYHNKNLHHLTYTTVEEKGTKPIQALCACKVISGGTEKDVIKHKGKLYYWFEMLKCVPYYFSKKPNVHNAPKLELYLKNICLACRTLVSYGYFHNDFHMGNVMLYENEEGRLHPIIIDFGLIKHIPKFEQFQEYTDVLTFAQIATLLDNCNKNTVCLDMEIVKSVFDKYKDKTNEFFKKMNLSTNTSDSLGYSKSVAKKIEKMMPKLPLLIKLNLVVAALSKEYFSFTKTTCGFSEPEWCGVGGKIDSAGDVIYEVRNPETLTVQNQENLTKDLTKQYSAHEILWKILTNDFKPFLEKKL